MPELNRREFLRSLAIAGAAAWAGPLVPRIGRADHVPFHYGVASGDPLSDRVIIWTHLTTSASSETLSWQVALNPDFAPVERAGTAIAAAASDHTVKVDVGAGGSGNEALTPGTTYYYRFIAPDLTTSPVGRTKTAPAGSLSNLRFAVASCQDFQAGYFPAWNHIAQQDLDFVLFCGDYIYEYGHDPADPVAVPARVHDPLWEIVTLDDYRRRYRTYRGDPALREAHRLHPFIATWDDHEVANDRWGTNGGGAENHNPTHEYRPGFVEGDYQARLAAAQQAYFEWMPIRQNALPIYRSFSFGSLVDLFMLDTRSYRDQPVGSLLTDPVANLNPVISSEGRTLLGPGQKTAFKDWLASSQAATWRIVGNQVMIGHLKLSPNIPDEAAVALAELTGQNSPYKLHRDGVPVNYDQWDDYQVERREILEYIRNPGGDVDRAGRLLGHPDRIENVVFLTGDLHTSWGIELYANPGNMAFEAPVAAEFAGPSITSINLNELVGSMTIGRALPHRSSIPVEQAAKAINPHMKYVNVDDNGYFLVEANAQRVKADFYYVQSMTDFETPVRDPNATVGLAPGGSWQVLDGLSYVVPAPV